MIGSLLPFLPKFCAWVLAHCLQHLISTTILTKTTLFGRNVLGNSILCLPALAGMGILDCGSFDERALPCDSEISASPALGGDIGGREICG